LVSYGTVCIRRKLRKEHRAPLTRDLGGQWYCKPLYIRICLSMGVLKIYIAFCMSAYFYLCIVLCTPIWNALKLEVLFTVGISL
jgi:hypothetical protein